MEWLTTVCGLSAPCRDETKAAKFAGARAIMSKAFDLTGQQFGSLTVLERADNDCRGKAQWRCRCGICGTEDDIRPTSELTRVSGHPSIMCRACAKKAFGAAATKGQYEAWPREKRPALA